VIKIYGSVDYIVSKVDYQVILSRYQVVTYLRLLQKLPDLALEHTEQTHQSYFLPFTFNT
jgi:bifunctional DNA-binding transcriptional regulator/antitoxin component of YhaV-PrlF toxin-antitoxin module